MSMSSYLFTSESVSEGHPDKVCDQISDAILDACLEEDPHSHVAVETGAKNDTIVLFGELTTGATIDPEVIVRDTVREIGYTDPENPFNADGLSVTDHLTEQGQEIGEAVADGETLGAGDQGLMFGYATNETPELMPLPIQLAHRLVEGLAHDRRNGESWIRPDAKSLVTVKYEGERPVGVQTVLISTQHAERISAEHPEDQTQEFIAEYVRDELVPDMIGDWATPDTNVIVNPSDSFVNGGPSVDAGLTGRKIIVDTYGGSGHHGGGAFSGKDPTKVDRSAAYFARFVARGIVEAGLADRAEIQVSYGIGLEDDISLHVDTLGTGDDRVAFEFARQFDFRPGKIIERLDLRRPIYRQTAAYGHFGKPDLSWEQTADEVHAW